MKRIVLITLCLCLAAGTLAGCKPNAGEGGSQPSASSVPQSVSEKEPGSAPSAGGGLRTGLAVVTSAADSKDAAEDNGVADISSTVVAVLVDGEGRVVDCAIDAVQTKIPFTKGGILTLNAGTIFPTKREQGKDYGLAEASDIGKEWYEQAAAFAGYVKGKTVDEVKGIALNERTAPADGELSASVTIAVGGFIDGIEKAVQNARDLGAGEGDVLGVGVVTNMKNSSDAGAKNGLAQAYSTYAAASFSPDGMITSCVLDGSQSDVAFDTAGKIASDRNGPFRTKNELGEEYGMKQASSIGKEWHEQAAAYAQYAVGRTVSGLEELTVTETGAPKGGELASSVTISVGAFNDAVKKAAAYAG